MKRSGAKTYSIEAPAKINLHLEILGRRPDGYHDLRSLFLLVNLSDRLRVTVGTERDHLHVRGMPGLDPVDNSVRRALESFRRAAPFSGGVDVELEKNIPAGAGLGGGSSDAASLLRLLNEVNGTPLSDAELLNLSAGIGSDVPFFLSAPGAVVEGRGEVIHPVTVQNRHVIALLVPDFSIQTADAYRWFDDGPPGARAISLSREEIRRDYEQNPPDEWRFFNSFLPVLGGRYPLFMTLPRELRAGGALATGLSGSGSAFFGVFDSATAAHACLGGIDGRFRYAGKVEPVRALPRVSELS